MQVRFYQLAEDSQAPQPDIPAHWHLACQLCAEAYRQQQRIFILTDNEQDAHALDEWLWQFEPERFIPHNLPGEGPARGAPVEISWQAPRQQRQLLINLSRDVPDFARRFAQVIEFVPADEQLKADARTRYKHYRQLGITPEMMPTR